MSCIQTGFIDVALDFQFLLQTLASFISKTQSLRRPNVPQDRGNIRNIKDLVTTARPEKKSRTRIVDV